MKWIHELFEFKEDSLFHELLSQVEYPWDVLKILKSYLLEVVKPLPKNFPKNVPVPEGIFLTEEGEVIPLKEVKEEDGRYFLKGEEIKGAIIQAGAFFNDDKVELKRSVLVESGAFIAGPSLFLEGVKVRHGAYVRGSVLAEKGAVIGHTTEVKNSIFLEEAKAAHFAYVGDSILGANVNLGAGTKLANLKFLKSQIKFKVDDQVIFTGLKKLGAIMGDESQTGCNAVIQPGTVLGKRCFVFPGRIAGPGLIPPKTKVK